MMERATKVHIEPLNQELFSACICDPPDYDRIESLLQAGANPLGAVLFNGNFGEEPRNLYAALMELYLNRTEETDNFIPLTRITEAFCSAGMDLRKPSIPYDGDDYFHPLYFYKFFCDERALNPLRVLCEHGMDADSAEECWADALFSMFNTGDDLNDPATVDWFFEIIQTLLLFASYPHIWENDPHLRKFMENEANNYDVQRFRDLEQYSISADLSYCDREYPKPSFALISILDNCSGETVWKFRFSWVKKPLPHNMVLMMGIPGSGKSTFYRQRLSATYERINLDTLHTRYRESEMLNVCFAGEQDFCVDNTNLTKEERARYICAAKERSWHVVGFFMQSIVKDCIARNELREGDEQLPAKAVAAMSNRMELPSREEGFDELYYVEITETGYNISAWRK